MTERFRIRQADTSTPVTASPGAASHISTPSPHHPHQLPTNSEPVRSAES
ncbi:hypothetical protein ACFH04_01050 [Streptomyces noboritoensis]|uniref:Uncharacterized protein n=1 Tax=Streptomyces noboritoensis TaxID=67337 RepID=A0ABV6T957_9ACTN